MNGHRKASVVWYKCKKTLFSWPAASQLALNGATWRNASYCIRSFSFNVSLTKSESFPQRKRSAGGACGYGWVDVVVPLCRRYSTWMPLNPQCHPDSFSRQKQCKYLAHEVGSCLVSLFPWIFRNCETYHTLKSHYIHLLANSKLPLFQWDLAASSFLAAVIAIPFIQHCTVQCQVSIHFEHFALCSKGELLTSALAAHMRKVAKMRLQ